MSALLEVENLSVAYGDLIAVWDFNLNAHPGQVTAVVGRNGAGKTSALAAIAGLLKTRSGSIRLEGREISGWSPWKRSRAGIAFVPEGKRIFRTLTVHENLVVSTHSGRSSGAEERFESIYTQFPALFGRRNQPAGALSGGQQQMLALAQAMISSPTVLVLDEPSAGLAPVVVDELYQSVLSLSKGGMAVVVVEQLVDEVGRVADNVVLMDRGRAVRQAPASSVSAAELEATILG